MWHDGEDHPKMVRLFWFPGFRWALHTCHVVRLRNQLAHQLNHLNTSLSNQGYLLKTSLGWFKLWAMQYILNTSSKNRLTYTHGINLSGKPLCKFKVY